MNSILFFNDSIATIKRVVVREIQSVSRGRFSASRSGFRYLKLAFAADFELQRRERDPMKELIEYIAKALVDHPEQVSVNVLEGSQATILELNVAKVDLGKIIGKQGRTAKAIRTILGATSAKQKKRAVLEIVE